MHSQAMRAMCHALVDKLPNEAIEDVIEAIADVFRFHLQKGAQRIEEASKRQRVSGRIATTRNKEAFTISED